MIAVLAVESIRLELESRVRLVEASNKLLVKYQSCGPEPQLRTNPKSSLKQGSVNISSILGPHSTQDRATPTPSCRAHAYPIYDPSHLIHYQIRHRYTHPRLALALLSTSLRSFGSDAQSLASYLAPHSAAPRPLSHWLPRP